MAVPQTSFTVAGGVGVVALAKHSTVLAPSAGTTGTVVLINGINVFPIRNQTRAICKGIIVGSCSFAS